MIPRKLIRFHTLPSWTFELPEEPIIGLYFNFHSFEKAETAEIALVRFVVPVVPEAAITLHPIDWVLAMEVPPVPASGIFFSAAAFKASLFAPLGSQLISMMPSILSSRMSLASSSSFLSFLSLRSRHKQVMKKCCTSPLFDL